MGVAALAIGVGVAGLASGVMGGMAGQSEAEAQYMANKINTERNNFQNSLANDKKNMAAARSNALRRWNNKQIAESAVRNLSDMKRFNRESFKANLKNNAKQQLSYMAGLEARATGKNIRGGMADRIQNLAKDNFAQQRKNIRKAKYTADMNVETQYKNALNQRDLLSRQEANIFMPGSTGVAPGSGTLNLMSSILGGTASGISAGAGVYGNLK